MSNQNKKKNANYTQKARQDAKVAKTRAVQAGNRSGSHGSRLPIDPNRAPNFLTRFFLGKTNILEQKPGKFQFPYAILAFLIPLIGGILAMHFRYQDMLETNKDYVFSLLYSDAYYQYYPFFVDFREILRSKGSLLYTWNVGMGTDYLGLFAYYAASPLNWLSPLIPESHLMEFYTLLVPIRMGFAGLFFAIFLQKVFDKNDISIALFGCFYATCAWVTGYLFNTMWLDTFALSPLVVLGTYNVLRHRKFILYTVSLFFSVFINYYIGFFTCIFTLLVFICYEICNWKDWKKLLTDLGLMAVFTILAIGMTALLTIPTFASLMTTSSTSGGFPKEFELLITKEKGLGGMIDAMLTVASNSFAIIQPNYKDYASAGGLPNIYCGVFATMFSLLYLSCRHIKWRERICVFALIVFINLSFIIVQLDYIWHGFHTTNAIPNRFSFIYSFVILVMAYRAWTLRRRMEPWQVMLSLAITFIALLICPGMEASSKAAEGSFITESKFLLTNLLLILFYSAALLCYCYRDEIPKHSRWKHKQVWYRNLHLRRSIGALALVAIIAVELVININAFRHLIPEQDVNSYPLYASDTAKVVAYMEEQESDNTFYRAEASQHNTYNDGMLNKYNGISTFSSAANVKVTNFAQAMGISGKDNYNRFVFEENSPLTHMFMNLKYIIDRQGFIEKNPYLTDIYQSGRVHLQENNFYLPLGFVTSPDLSQVSFITNSDLEKDRSAVFSFQNRFLSGAMGKEVTPWTILPDDSFTIKSSNEATLTVQDLEKGKCYYSFKEGASGEPKVTYTYTFEESGLFCVNYHLPDKNRYEAKLNGTKLHHDSANNLSFVGSVCQVEPGDKVDIIITCPASKGNETITLVGALLDQQVMTEAYEQFSQSTLNVTKFEDTQIIGDITVTTPGLMYTSVPQTNGNWHVYVDGKEADIVLIGDVMIGVMLEEGYHTISFQYKNKAFSTGLIISIICAALFLALCIILGLKRTLTKKSANAAVFQGSTPEIAMTNESTDDTKDPQ